MRALLHSLQRRLVRHGRAAGAWRDVLELLSATALCALLEGWWRLRDSDAMTVMAARLTLALLPIAPLALAAAAAGYLKAHIARLRKRRADIALYRVVGGDMQRAACRQALAAALRLSMATAGGIFIALLLLPPLATADAPPSLALTALGALAAALAVAADAAWRTWNVPAAYDLPDSIAADDVADEPSDDHAGAAIEQQLRALYAASPLLARRQARPASRYRHALNPLLLAVYALLMDKHHPLHSHPDDDLAQTGDDSHSDAQHAPGAPDTAGDGASVWHQARMNHAATPSWLADAGTEAQQANRPHPAIESGSAPSLMASADSPAARPSPTAPAHLGQPHAALTGAPVSAETAAHGYDAGTPHNLSPIRTTFGSPPPAWSALTAISTAPISQLQQSSIAALSAGDLLLLTALPSSLADLAQTPLNITSITALTVNAIKLMSAQSIASLSQSGIGGQTGLIETILAATRPVDTGLAHAGATAEPSPSSGIVIVGQPLDGHGSALHLA